MYIHIRESKESVRRSLRTDPLAHDSGVRTLGVSLPNCRKSSIHSEYSCRFSTDGSLSLKNFRACRSRVRFPENSQLLSRCRRLPVGLYLSVAISPVDLRSVVGTPEL